MMHMLMLACNLHSILADTVHDNMGIYRLFISIEKMLLHERNKKASSVILQKSALWGDNKIFGKHTWEDTACLFISTDNKPPPKFFYMHINEHKCWCFSFAALGDRRSLVCSWKMWIPASHSLALHLALWAGRAAILLWAIVSPFSELAQA